MTGQKKVLFSKDVPSRIVPHFPELYVKECYHRAVSALPGLVDYLPDPYGEDNRLPEREFFWRVMYALFPGDTDKYISDVEDSKRSKTNLQDLQFEISIKEEFIDELLKYDYHSKKRGRGISSILMNKINKGKSYKMKASSK